MKEVIVIATDLTPKNFQQKASVNTLALAPVQDVPFLSFVIDALQEKSFTKYIFAISSKEVQAFVQETYPDLQADFCLNSEPMLAVNKAFETATEEDIVVVDAAYVTSFDEKLLNKFHQIKNSIFTTVTKWMKDVDGLTSLQLNEKGLVTNAEHQANYAVANVYAGISMLHVPSFLMDAETNGTFSSDYLLKKVLAGEVFASEQDGTVVSIINEKNFMAAQESNL